MYMQINMVKKWIQKRNDVDKLWSSFCKIPKKKSETNIKIQIKMN